MSGPARKEIYTYTATAPLYAIGWGHRPGREECVAVGTFVEEYANKVDVVQLDTDTDQYVTTASFEHSYPPTKIMFIPDKGGTHSDLLATSGDYLRLWTLEDGGVKPLCLLNGNKDSEYCAPLTSLDWNENEPNLIGCSSIDTTCTVWDIETQQIKAQLIAHDQEVYDISFAPIKDTFASVSADGSVRRFDLRSLDRSSVVYEHSAPLLRVVWCKTDPNYLATLALASDKILVVDVRSPTAPVLELIGHQAAVNGIDWSPLCSNLCSAGDDRQALIWQLPRTPESSQSPVLTYTAEAQANHIKWAAMATETVNWVAITYLNKLQVLRV